MTILPLAGNRTINGRYMEVPGFFLPMIPGPGRLSGTKFLTKTFYILIIINGHRSRLSAPKWWLHCSFFQTWMLLPLLPLLRHGKKGRKLYKINPPHSFPSILFSYDYRYPCIQDGFTSLFSTSTWHTKWLESFLFILVFFVSIPWCLLTSL